MPIFEYRCRACSHQFELIVHGSTRPACPNCRSEELDKRLSVFAVGASTNGGRTVEVAPCGSCGDPRGPGACSLDRVPDL